MLDVLTMVALVAVRMHDVVYDCAGVSAPHAAVMPMRMPGAVRCGVVRCGAVRCGAVRCGAVRMQMGLSVGCRCPV